MSEELSFQLEGQVGRLDKVVTELLKDYDYSRSQVQDLIKKGQVKVNSKLEKANYKTNGDELIHLTLPQEEEIDIVQEEMDLDIIYEDEDLLVVNKPAGIVVHPSKGHLRGTLVNGLVYYLNNNLSNLNTIRPGIVHRLDKDTSGLLLVAKNDLTHRRLSQQIEERLITRRYLALVNGQPDVKQGIIEVPLARDPNNRLRFQADLKGKPALSRYHVLGTYPELSLVELELETGRTHQLRVHMEYIGHPIVGDPVYRRGLGEIHTSVSNLSDGQYLHAYNLDFQHPTNGEYLSFKTPIPTRFEELLISQEDFSG